MPLVRRYVITQTREITVTASDPLEAVKEAQLALENAEGSFRNVVSTPKVIEMIIRVDQ